MIRRRNEGLSPITISFSGITNDKDQNLYMAADALKDLGKLEDKLMAYLDRKDKKGIAAVTDKMDTCLAEIREYLNDYEDYIEDELKKNMKPMNLGKMEAYRRNIHFNERY